MQKINRLKYNNLVYDKRQTAEEICQETLRVSKLKDFCNNKERSLILGFNTDIYT
jgi:hypothetical protein